MGQCCSKQNYPKKQNKNIDDRRMFKAAIEFMDKEFSVGIGYNRRAKKDYSNVVHVDNIVHQVIQSDERARPEANEAQREIEDRRRKIQEARAFEEPQEF